MFCTNCGSKVEVGERFCPNCGEQIEAGPGSERGAGRSRGPLILGLSLAGALILVLIVVAAISAFGGGHSTPKAAVEKFMTALEKGDAEGIIDLLDPEQIDEEDMMGIQLGLGFITQGYLSLEVRKHVIRVVESDHDTASVEVELIGDNSTIIDTMEIQLIRRDGKWYIDEFL